MLALGTPAPNFALPDTDAHLRKLADYKGAPALVVAFICNHCPFVKHVQQGFTELFREYQAKGVAVVAINANDTTTHPGDSPEQMDDEAKKAGYTFPYLYDESQEVAKAYRAACTPDFFVFDKDQRLVYRGQMDDSRPGGDVPVTGADLRAALDAVLAGKPPASEQKPSMGCNIKWRAGNEPDYYGG